VSGGDAEPGTGGTPDQAAGRPRPKAEDYRAVGRRFAPALITLGVTSPQLLRMMRGLQMNPDGCPAGDEFPGAGLAWCGHTGQVPEPALAELVCGGTFQRLITDESGRPLDLGHAQRLASAAQRSALGWRDRGCVIPGCDRPAADCRIHHVTWWRNGGATDVENLALTCQGHHSDVHSGFWELALFEGLPYARLSETWIDPTRTWRRNIRNHPPGTPATLAPGVRDHPL
jgi:hypothetical protein